VNLSRPFSDACEQNKFPILEVLKEQLIGSPTVLEVASGTGQHAVFFTQQMAHLTWQPTDLASNLPGIRAWIEYSQCKNVLPPIELDVSSAQWNVGSVEYIFSANAMHIMSWKQVVALFSGAGKIALPGARLIVYGPFNYNNEYTSESNRQFDALLRNRDPLSGIRSYEDVNELATAAQFTLIRDYEMPANNRTLVWQKRTGCPRDE
jgi:hypothetical protein